MASSCLPTPIAAAHLSFLIPHKLNSFLYFSAHMSVYTCTYISFPYYNSSVFDLSQYLRKKNQLWCCRLKKILSSLNPRQSSCPFSFKKKRLKNISIYWIKCDYTENVFPSIHRCLIVWDYHINLTCIYTPWCFDVKWKHDLLSSWGSRD